MTGVDLTKSLTLAEMKLAGLEPKIQKPKIDKERVKGGAKEVFNVAYHATVAKAVIWKGLYDQNKDMRSAFAK